MFDVEGEVVDARLAARFIVGSIGGSVSGIVIARAPAGAYIV